MLKAQDIVVLAFLAVVVGLAIRAAFSPRLRRALQRPARSLIVVLAFILLVVLTLVALKW